MNASFRYDLAKSKRNVPIDTPEFARAMCRLFMDFRADRKDTIGKYASYINNVIVGGSPVKQTVLSFLVDTGVFKWKVRQYIIDKQALKALDLSMYGIARMDEETMRKAYVSFCAWRHKNDRH